MPRSRKKSKIFLCVDGNHDLQSSPSSWDVSFESKIKSEEQITFQNNIQQEEFMNFIYFLDVSAGARYLFVPGCVCLWDFFYQNKMSVRQWFSLRRKLHP